MALEKAPTWTQIYYDIVEHYFWRPQEIGRKSNPDQVSQPWPAWQERLESREPPLNHMLDLFFHIVPQPLLDQIISALLGETRNGLELVRPSPGTLDPNVVQPDIIVSNGSELVFVEMKVESRSSIDQFAKYTIAAHRICEEEPMIREVDLVVLGRRARHENVWEHAEALGLSSEDDVRETVARGFEEDPNIWDQPGVLRFTRQHPESLESLSELTRSMGLHLADYETFRNVLAAYAAQEGTVERLIQGLLEELRKRDLVDG